MIALVLPAVLVRPHRRSSTNQAASPPLELLVIQEIQQLPGQTLKARPHP